VIRRCWISQAMNSDSLPIAGLGLKVLNSGYLRCLMLCCYTSSSGHSWSVDNRCSVSLSKYCLCSLFLTNIANGEQSALSWVKIRRHLGQIQLSISHVIW
jgi:hypothetical protein